MAREYREITRDLPTEAFLGESIEMTPAALDAFYRYFDLSNYELFLAEPDIRRVSSKTAGFWREGIAHNLGRPAFREAWRVVGCRAGMEDDFDHVRKLLATLPSSDEPRREADAEAPRLSVR